MKHNAMRGTIRNIHFQRNYANEVSKLLLLINSDNIIGRPRMWDL